MSDISNTINLLPNQYQNMLDNYASIVEKTNNQLGLGLNVSIFLVSFLSVLIALIAICVAWTLWKNSKDQKEKVEQFFSGQKKMIEKGNKEFFKKRKELEKKGEERAKKMESKFENLINEYEKQLKVAGKNNKRQIQDAIDELKKEKELLSSYINPINLKMDDNLINNFIPPTSISHAKSCFFPGNLICNKCKKSFNTSDNIIYDRFGRILNKAVCPYCNTENDF